MQLLLTLLSGALGAGAMIFYYEFSEKRRAKMRTLKDIVGYRYELLDAKSDKKFFKALNEVCIVFHDSKLVLNKLNEYHEVITSNQTNLTNKKLVRLIKEMCKDLNYDVEHDVFESDFFLIPFNKNNIDNS